MKKFLMMTMALMVWAAAMAVPARQKPLTAKQGDGTTVTLMKHGDEWHHWTTTTDGHRVVRAADGSFYYVKADGRASTVLAHDASVRSASEVAFLDKAANTFTSDKKKLQKARKTSKLNGVRRRATQVPNIGRPRVPIILVEFSDIKFSKSDAQIKTYFENQMNASGEGVVSCYQYFVDQSAGQYTPEFDILGPVQVGKRSTYGGNDEDTGEDQALDQFVRDAVDKLPNVDWSLYDNDNDGVVDVVVLEYAGVGEASSYVEESIWPCQWDMVSAGTKWEWSDQYDDWIITEEGELLTLDSGMVIDKFAVFNEMNGAYDDEPGDIDGVGTFCHEYSHCLGLPDFYCTDYSEHYGMGSWSCLDYGCNNNDGYTPCGYTAYEKWFMGWKDMEEAISGTKYNLDATNLTTGKGIKVPSDNPNEYYILENRQLTGWDAYIPNHGLMVTHVNYNADRWESNEVNNYDDKGMSIIPADNSLKMDGVYDWDDGRYYYYTNINDQTGDLFPYNGVNELTDESEPAATLYNGSGFMGKPITNIEDNNGIVTFNFMKDDLPGPELNDATNITNTSFTASWSDLGALSYTLRVQYVDPNAAQLILTEHLSDVSGKNGYDYGDNNKLDDIMNNAGWTGSKVYAENGIRLATGKANGHLASPTLNTAGLGKLSVVLTGKSYGNDGDINVTVSTSKASTTVELSTFSETKTVVLDAADNDKVTFTAVAKNRPIFNEILIYAGDATNEGSAPMLFHGIEGTCYTVTGLIPEATYRFDVKAFLADDETAWSEAKTVTLPLESVNKFDLNGDGYVNTGDVSFLYNAILAGNFDAKYDLNGEGHVNVGDVATLYQAILQ